MISRRAVLGTGLAGVVALAAAGRLSAQAPSHTLLLTDGHAQHPLAGQLGRIVVEPATDALIVLAVAHLALPGSTVIAATSPRTHLLLTFALHDTGAGLTEEGSLLIART